MADMKHKNKRPILALVFHKIKQMVSRTAGTAKGPPVKQASDWQADEAAFCGTNGKAAWVCIQCPCRFAQSDEPRPSDFLIVGQVKKTHNCLRRFSVCPLTKANRVLHQSLFPATQLGGLLMVVCHRTCEEGKG